MECPFCGYRNPDGEKICSVCGGSLDFICLHLPLGTKLKKGNYTVGKVLGVGGFGITYKGGNAILYCPVAIKEFFPPSCLRKGTSVLPSSSFSVQNFQLMKQRFIQEARMLARFNHPGIVKVNDVFEENNTAYIVMEYLEGETLESLIANRERLGEEEAVEYIIKVAEALEIVHNAGIVHRDIKPANIFVCKNGRVVLIDFGAAREFSAGLLQKHTVILTHGFAPFEQYTSVAKRGPFTDIYALSATLYYLLTGQLPVSAPDRIQGIPLPDVCELNPSVSSQVADAIKKGLALKAEERPQTVREFIDLLKTSKLISLTSTTSPSKIEVPPKLEGILSVLYHLAEKIREQEMLVESLLITHLTEEVATCNLQLEEGKEYIIAGAGDNEVIKDLDAAVYSEEGELIQEDTLTDNLPILRFQTTMGREYKVRIWAGEMEGRDGLYDLVVGRRITSWEETEMANIWESVFGRFLSLVLAACLQGLEIWYAELDIVEEGTTAILSLVLEKGYSYYAVATGDEVNIADLDMEVHLPDGRTIADKGPDNLPRISFTINMEGETAFEIIPSIFHAGRARGYFAFFLGRFEK